VEKFLKDPQTREYLHTLADRLAALAEFNLQTIESVVRGLAEELGIKPAALMGASRVAVTGQSISPGIFEVMLILGRETTVQRLSNLPSML
jgi:glutamyl/glutaminyl-tRNA synthetase